MLNSLSLALLSAFAITGHDARLMTNPRGFLGRFTAWGELLAVDLNALPTCSPDGTFLIEAKAFRDQNSDFTAFYEFGKRVIRIMAVRSDGDYEFGTGFLLGNGYFMTARHVLPLNRDYANAEIAIDILAEGRTPTTECNNIPFDCSGLFNNRDIQFIMSGNNAVRDWTIYRFTGDDIAKFTAQGGGSGLQLDMNLQPVSTNIHSFHHLRGVGKKGNARAGPAASSTAARILSNAKSIESGGSEALYYLNWMDADEGASGAPIFSATTNRVIGVHRGTTRDASGQSVCDPANNRGPIATRTIDIYEQMAQHDVQRSVGLTDADIDAIRGAIFA